MGPPKCFCPTGVLTLTTGRRPQLAGLRAATVNLGVWITLALYAIDGLADVL